MIIKTNSWHYRWMNFLRNSLGKYDPMPNTLCAYFWHFVGLNIEMLCMCSVMVFIISVIPLLLWSRFHNHSSSAGFCLVVILVWVTVGSLVLLSFWIEKKFKKLESENSSSFVAVIVGMIRATKSRVCPVIKYEK